MTTKTPKKSNALKFLEKLSGGPLSFAELIYSIRMGEEMTYKDFASKLGISRSHLCDIEKGRKSVSLDRAIAFADLLGYSKDQFARLALQSQVNNAGLRVKVHFSAA